MPIKGFFQYEIPNDGYKYIVLKRKIKYMTIISDITSFILLLCRQQKKERRRMETLIICTTFHCQSCTSRTLVKLTQTCPYVEVRIVF